MGIPDLLNFVAREFPQCVTRLPTPQEIRLQQQRAIALQQQPQQQNKSNNNNITPKPVYNYALVDMSNIIQTIGVQAAFTLLTQQTVITHGIFLVADGNRQRAGARRERMMKMFRADKDVDMAISQLSSQLKAHFESQMITTSSSSSTAAPGSRRGREGEDEGQKQDQQSRQSSPVVIVNIGSENYGEGDFKLLHLHRHLTLSGANTQLQLQQLQNQQQQQKQQQEQHQQKKGQNNSNNNLQQQQQQQQQQLTMETILPPLFVSTNPTTGRPDTHLGSPNPVAPTFLFVSEDSDLFCGALAGPSPQNVFLATTFHDLMTSLCVVSVGDCGEALAKKAGIDLSSEFITPAEKNRCIQFVALDVITLFTILLGNGQCPALAKGATRVDSRAVWTAYCNVRWPSDKAEANAGQHQEQQFDDYYGGGGGDDYYGYYDNNNNADSASHNNNNNSAALASAAATSTKVAALTANSSDDEKFGNFLIEVQDPKKTHQGPSSSLVLNCELLAKVLAHFHCTDALAHAPAAEQRKLAREYLINVSRSAFRYCAGTTIDTREEATPQVPSLASLAYVADDSTLRFYPFTTTFGLGMNNNTTASGVILASDAKSEKNNNNNNNNKKNNENDKNKNEKNNLNATAATATTFTMNATVPGLKVTSQVSFSKSAVKNKEHKYTFGELTKMYTTIIDTNANNKNEKKSNVPQKEKFSFELRRMIPVATTSTPTIVESAQTKGKAKTVENNKKGKNKKNGTQSQNADSTKVENAEDNNTNDVQQQDETDFSYFDSEVMDEEERKQQHQKEVEKKKKKMSKKQKVKVAEIEADVLQRKKDKNKKKNRKKKDKKATTKAEKEAAQPQNQLQRRFQPRNNTFNQNRFNRY